MHETSLVRSLLMQVADLLEKHNGESVESIEVELGPLTGVEPILVQSAFAQLAPDYGMVSTLLQIREIPLKAQCRTCGSHFVIDHFRFQCTICSGADIQVLSGDEFRLLSVSIRPRVQEEVRE